MLVRLDICILLSEDFKSAVHLGVRIVGDLGILFGQLLDPLFQEIVFRVEDDTELWDDFLADFKSHIVLRHICRSRFVLVALLTVHEDSLRVLVISWIAIKDKTFVHASGRSQVSFDDLLKDIFRQAHVDLRSIKVRVLFLARLLIVGYLYVLQFLNGRFDELAKFIMLVGSKLDHIINHQMRDSIVRS